MQKGWDVFFFSPVEGGGANRNRGKKRGAGKNKNLLQMVGGDSSVWHERR